MSSAMPTTARRSPAARLTSGDAARGAAGSVGGAGVGLGAGTGAGAGRVAARKGGGATAGRGASSTASSPGPASTGRRRQYHRPAPSATRAARIHAQNGVPEEDASPVAAIGVASDSGTADTVGAATSGDVVSSGGRSEMFCPDEPGAASGAADAARGVSGAAVSRRAGPGAADGTVVVAGCVGVTRGGAGVGVGAGVGAGGCDPRRSFGATGGRPLSDGPCTPGARPSLAGGRRKIDDGAGVGVSVSCARTVAVAISASTSATNGNRAALLPCPKFLSIIMILRSRIAHLGQRR